MPIKKEPLFQKSQLAFQKLTAAALTLNSASDKLGQSIAELDASLKKLNLGISSWVEFSTWSSPEGLEHSVEKLGYDKINGKWGIAIRTIAGHESFPEEADEEEWLFNDAPRALRIRATEMIPNLIDLLTKNAIETTKQVNGRAAEFQELAEAINIVLDQSAEKPSGKR